MAAKSLRDWIGNGNENFYEETREVMDIAAGDQIAKYLLLIANELHQIKNLMVLSQYVDNPERDLTPEDFS